MARGLARRRRLRVAADHRTHDLAVPALHFVEASHNPAVTHDDDAVGDVLDLIEPVGNVETGYSLGADTPDMGVKTLGLGFGQRGGRLVEDDQPCRLGQRRGDRNEPLLGGAQHAQPARPARFRSRRSAAAPSSLRVGPGDPGSRTAPGRRFMNMFSATLSPGAT